MKTQKATELAKIVNKFNLWRKIEEDVDYLLKPHPREGVYISSIEIKMNGKTRYLSDKEIVEQIMIDLKRYARTQIVYCSNLIENFDE